MKRIIGLGAGGHAKVILDVLGRSPDVEVIGLLDPDPALWGSELMSVPVLGDDELLAEQYAKGVRQVFIGVGGTGDNRPRRRLFERATRQGFDVVTVVHPSAVISPSAVIGRGAAIMAAAVVNAAARLGEDVIVNTGAIVEHDCVVGDHAHVATGARLAGGVMVGEGAHVGIGASLRQGVVVGRGAIVAAGAAVLDDVADGAIVAGVPARVLDRGNQ